MTERVTERENELTEEELQQQQGEKLPPREVMSVIDPDPSQFTLIPEKPEPFPTENTPPNDV